MLQGGCYICGKVLCFEPLWICQNKTEYLLNIVIMFTNYGTILRWSARGSVQEGVMITWNGGIKAIKALFLIFHKFMH